MHKFFLSIVIVVMVVGSNCYASDKIAECWTLLNSQERNSDYKNVVDVGIEAIKTFPNEASGYICLGMAYYNAVLTAKSITDGRDALNNAEGVWLYAEKIAKRPEELGSIYSLQE